MWVGAAPLLELRSAVNHRTIPEVLANYPMSPSLRGLWRSGGAVVGGSSGVPPSSSLQEVPAPLSDWMRVQEVPPVPPKLGTFNEGVPGGVHSEIR